MTHLGSNSPLNTTISGQYDKDYLAYLHQLLSLFGQFGFKVYVSMHQDVWSRYSGGSGAPAWTLDAVGLSIPDLPQAHAAWLQGVKGGGHSEEERGLWPTGYQKLAASTMNTVFWGGEVFAPKLKIGGESGINSTFGWTSKFGSAMCHVSTKRFWSFDKSCAQICRELVSSRLLCPSHSFTSETWI